MCGRYAATRDPAKLAADFDAVDGTEGEAPAADRNVAPTKRVLTVVQRHPRDAAGETDPDRTVRSIRVMKWGLVPHWAKDAAIGSRMINARADTAASKPAFRTSLARRRCIIPADGWYEWRRDGSTKQPYYMTNLDGSPLAFAGLWSTWRDKTAEDDSPLLISCAVLTTDAIGPLTDVHDRMPLLLSHDAWARWLDPDATEVDSFLVPPPDDLVAGLELRPVSTMVNNVRNNGPQLTERVELAEQAIDLDAERDAAAGSAPSSVSAAAAGVTAAAAAGRAPADTTAPLFDLP